MLGVSRCEAKRTMNLLPHCYPTSSYRLFKAAHSTAVNHGGGAFPRSCTISSRILRPGAMRSVARISGMKSRRSRARIHRGCGCRSGHHCGAAWFGRQHPDVGMASRLSGDRTELSEAVCRAGNSQSTATTTRKSSGKSHEQVSFQLLVLMTSSSAASASTSDNSPKRQDPHRSRSTLSATAIQAV